MSKCIKCGQEFTDDDKYTANYKEVTVAADNQYGRKIVYKHIRCPGQPERAQPTLDWDTPLPEANPSSWIVK